jgi:hypothetical protein
VTFSFVPVGFSVKKRLRERRPVNGTVVNHAVPCVTIADFRETKNVDTYK